MISFASDNNSGVHPRVFEAMRQVNQGPAPAYGRDAWTAAAEKALAEHFGPCRAFFVFLGTAANVLGLKSLVRTYNAVICAETAHAYTDECGAPEALIGCKLLPVPSYDGKIKVEDCVAHLERALGAVHHSSPRVVSITQATEVGTVYTVEEIRAIADFCHKNSLYLHMDGARYCNAAAYLNLPLADLAGKAGVDVLSFGGTKNGLMFGEAVLFFNQTLAEDFPYIRKQNMQLLSKMRFVAAQFSEYLSGDLWLANARQANNMAALLRDSLSGAKNVAVTRPVQINGVFARLPLAHVEKLQKSFSFYIWDAYDAPGFEKGWPEVRWMTSFNTTEQEVLEFASAVKSM